MKAISFLGAGKAYDTTYVMPDGRDFTASYFPAALVRFYRVDELKVFVTTDAQAMHFARLEALVAGCVKACDPVPIPDGRNEGELWTVFQAVADSVAPGEQVIFDITHGFRSLPFLSFLAAAYLRAVKGIHLEAVLYGALEAGDRSIQPARAPVFDLTRFVSLLDWLTAADHFTRFGDARDLAALLRDPQATPVNLAAASGDREAQRMTSALHHAAAALEKVTAPLLLARPVETMEQAARFEGSLERARADLADQAPPFALIADQVRQAYAPFGLADPLVPGHVRQALDIQRQLVHWYISKQQVMQAVTLAREWLVSWVMHWLDEYPLDDRGRREAVTGVINTEAHRLPQGGAGSQTPEAGRSFRALFLREVPHLEDALRLYNELSQVRNDLDHTGMRKGALLAATLARRVAELCVQLDALPLAAPEPGV